MATRINHKSDFTSYEQFTRYDKPVAVPERVRITYFTETGFPRCFVAERNGDILKNCSLSDDGMSLRVYVALSRQYIGTGPLKKIITETVEDANFPNGEKRLDSVAESNVILWSGNSDNGLDTEDGAELLPFRYGYSAYELAKIHGYEGTEEEYALAPLLAINKLEDYAKKDLSNISDTALRDKIHAQEDWVVEYKIDDDHSVSFDADQDAGQMVGTTAEDVDKALYFSTTSPSFGSAISPVSARIIYGRESLSYVAMFVGSDDYVHKIVWDEAGNLTKQYAYSLDDFATKEEVESIDFAGYLTSQGYKPTRIVDMGKYSSSEGFVFTDPLLSELAAAINAVSEGKATLLLKGSTPYGDPLFFSGVSVRIDAGIDYRLTFLMSNGRSYWISFEAGYPDSVQQGFTEGGGSGTITSEVYTDNKDYKEI